LPTVTIWVGYSYKASSCGRPGQSLVISDIRVKKLITKFNDGRIPGLTHHTGCFVMATVGVKGLKMIR